VIDSKNDLIMKIVEKSENYNPCVELFKKALQLHKLNQQSKEEKKP
jgi:hypothetical protein